MRKFALVVLVALAIAVPLSAETPKHPQKPGKWNVKMQMEMPGMPFKMPAVNFDICLTEEDLQDPQKAVPNDPKSKCNIGEYKVDGNTVTWTVDCPKQKMSGNGEITYTVESYSGWMKLKTADDQEMKTMYSGTWKGECTKKK